jgi:hypothetical protein
LVWASIHAVVADLPPYEELAGRLKEAVQQTDFVELTQDNLQTGMLALHTASHLVISVGDEDLRSRLKEQLVGVAGHLAELNGSANNVRASVANLMESAELGALVDAALALAVATRLPENVHPEFAALVDQLVRVWPSTAPLFKLIVLRLCEELPISQSKQYWPLLTRMRAE